MSPSFPPPLPTKMAPWQSLQKATNPRDKVAMWASVWFGCGYMPRAPGTAGSLGALPLAALAALGGPFAIFVAGVVVTVGGIWSSGRVARLLGKGDPQIVVIDEVAGVLLTLAVAPATVWGWVAGFVLFRAFDQLKPWPIRKFERLPGGFGIMMDDVAAAAAAGVLLLLAQLLGWL